VKMVYYGDINPADIKIIGSVTCTDKRSEKRIAMEEAMRVGIQKHGISGWALIRKENPDLFAGKHTEYMKV
jgi:hypothetical protein